MAPANSGTLEAGIKFEGQNLPGRFPSPRHSSLRNRPVTHTPMSSSELFCYHCGRYHPREEMRQIETKGGKKWRCIKSIEATKIPSAQRDAFMHTVGIHAPHPAFNETITWSTRRNPLPAHIANVRDRVTEAVVADLSTHDALTRRINESYFAALRILTA